VGESKSVARFFAAIIAPVGKLLHRVMFYFATDLRMVKPVQGSKLLQPDVFMRASWLLGRLLAAGMAS
jgi:hypothetical protein